jgi:hypothetical protein
VSTTTIPTSTLLIFFFLLFWLWMKSATMQINKHRTGQNVPPSSRSNSPCLPFVICHKFRFALLLGGLVVAAFVLRSNETESIQALHLRQMQSTKLRLQNQQHEQHQQQQHTVKYPETRPGLDSNQEDEEEAGEDDSPANEEGDDAAEDGQGEEEAEDLDDGIEKGNTDDENGDGKCSKISGLAK